MFQNADDVKKFIADEDVKFVDVRFCDLPGVMQHFNVARRGVRRRPRPTSLAFDGSSIRGFQAIHESDMPLRPTLSHRARRPLPPGQDAQHQLLHPRPDHAARQYSP